MTPARRTIRAVFFDAGNTLLHQDYAGIAEILARLGRPVSPDALRRAEYRARVPLDAYLRAGRSTEDPETIRFYRERILAEVDPEKVVPRERFWEEVLALRRKRHPYGQADPEAPAALTALAGAGLRLGVISNADGSLAGLLAATGLASFFDAALDSRVVGVEKPSPAIFEMACRRLGVAPHEAAHIGDLPAIDAEPASGVGLFGWTLDPGNVWGGHALPRAASLTDFARRILGNGA